MLACQAFPLLHNSFCYKKKSAKTGKKALVYLSRTVNTSSLTRQTRKDTCVLFPPLAQSH